MDLAVAVLQFASAGLAVAIYGTVDHPRHPAMPFLFRSFVFVGFVVAAITLYSETLLSSGIWALTGLWMFSVVTLVLAEFEIGNRYLVGGTVLLSVGLISYAIWSGA
jgi:uncharacterized protein (DUF983 family)